MEPERISFPVAYPVKVVAKAAPDLRERVDAVFALHFGDLAAEDIAERPSANSNYVSLTYVPVVQDESQLRMLHIDLKQVDGVIMVL